MGGARSRLILLAGAVLQIGLWCVFAPSFSAQHRSLLQSTVEGGRGGEAAVRAEKPAFMSSAGSSAANQRRQLKAVRPLLEPFGPPLRPLRC